MPGLVRSTLLVLLLGLGPPLHGQWSGAGDLDLNGARDVLDVVVLAGHLVGNVPQGSVPFLAPLAAAELNADGRIDILDLVLLQGSIVGNVPELPVGGITVFLPGNVPLVMVRIRKGTFLMGAPPSERSSHPEEQPEHAVTLTRDYLVGKHEVQQAQWQAVMGSNPSAFVACGETCPVEGVSWNQVAAPGGFLDSLNQFLSASGQPGAGHFRLPTEAEWENAARAGTPTRFSFGDALDCIDGCDKLHTCSATPHGWWCANAVMKTHPVGTRLPNPWGLHDLHGNVSEWVEDWYGPYSNGEAIDPKGPKVGSLRVHRGGGWFGLLPDLRSAARVGHDPAYGYYTIGVRLAMSVPTEP